MADHSIMNHSCGVVTSSVDVLMSSLTAAVGLVAADAEHALLCSTERQAGAATRVWR